MKTSKGLYKCLGYFEILENGIYRLVGWPIMISTPELELKKFNCRELILKLFLWYFCFLKLYIKKKIGNVIISILGVNPFFNLIFAYKLTNCLESHLKFMLLVKKSKYDVEPHSCLPYYFNVWRFITSSENKNINKNALYILP